MQPLQFSRRSQQLLAALAVFAAPWGIGVGAQSATAVLEIGERTLLEGIPHARAQTAATGSRRTPLRVAEAAKGRLAIRVRDGRFFWESRAGLPLRPMVADGFVYLMSGEPGHYIRIQRIGDHLAYVQHVDTGTASVTYWGELRVAVGR